MGERWGPAPLWWERAVLFIFSAIFLSFLRTLSLKLSLCVCRSGAFNVCGSFPLFSTATSIFFTQRVCGPLVSTGVNKTNFARPRPICSKTKTADLKTKTNMFQDQDQHCRSQDQDLMFQDQDQDRRSQDQDLMFQDQDRRSQDQDLKFQDQDWRSQD